MVSPDTFLGTGHLQLDIHTSGFNRLRIIDPVLVLDASRGFRCRGKSLFGISRPRLSDVSYLVSSVSPGITGEPAPLLTSAFSYCTADAAT